MKKAETPVEAFEQLKEQVENFKIIFARQPLWYKIAVAMLLAALFTWFVFV